MFELHHLSAQEQWDWLHRGEITPVELTTHYLERIGRLNPRLGAFTTVTADAALERAATLGEHVPRTAALWGIPLGDKDLTRRGRRPNHIRLAPVRALRPRGLGRARRRARRRRRDQPRQDQRARIRDAELHRVARRAARAQPVEPRARGRRQQRGSGRRGLGRPPAGRARLGRRRLDPHPGGGDGTRRAQAGPGARPVRLRPHLARGARDDGPRSPEASRTRRCCSMR